MESNARYHLPLDDIGAVLHDLSGRGNERNEMGHLGTEAVDIFGVNGEEQKRLGLLGEAACPEQSVRLRRMERDADTVQEIPLDIVEVQGLVNGDLSRHAVGN